MLNRKSSSKTPSQVNVPCARQDSVEMGGVMMSSTAIGPGRVMTPNREEIGMTKPPMAGAQGGACGAEFISHVSHASGKRRG